ncbi:glycosyltransferase family 2 protein [Blastococcus sp. TF02A-30]|uniref:glycosyltransferase family 2 protein n=1 Tax=Blastococcus sp. TF02A-30 TaxID=2250580 RepID=UPI001314DF09|nr:glycosyltransferase family 2 protein [Blastococcus sp. TF02A-30]
MTAEPGPRPHLSVVVPCYDEAEVLPLLEGRLRAVLDGLGVSYQVVMVGDGSRDGTGELLRKTSVGWPQLEPVVLARNVGHQLALTAGLDHAEGDYVVTMDADLQDPPELIPVMLERAVAEGVDVVYARRSDRRTDSRFKRWTAAAYYDLVRRGAGVDLPDHVGDYRLLSRRVVLALRMLPERHRVYRLLIPWLGFPSAVVEHRREPRAAGRTKYPVRKMVSLAWNGLSSFTTSPLHLATTVGASASVLALLGAVGVIVAFLLGRTVPGWASVSVAVLFLAAVQLLCLGVLGAYVGRIYEEVQQRPMYRVDQETGRRPRVEDDREEPPAGRR